MAGRTAARTAATAATTNTTPGAGSEPPCVALEGTQPAGKRRKKKNTKKGPRPGPAAGPLDIIEPDEPEPELAAGEPALHADEGVELEAGRSQGTRTVENHFIPDYTMSSMAKTCLMCLTRLGRVDSNVQPAAGHFVMRLCNRTMSDTFWCAS